MSICESSSVVLGDSFEAALIYAAQLHRHQRRKVTGVPYISHLMAVAALVLEDRGSEDEAIAALLHDAVEDQGGEATLEIIRQRFGTVVAELVMGCTKPDTVAGLGWREQKRLYLGQIRAAKPEVQRIVLADKLHNGRSLLELLQTYGSGVWGHFAGGQQGTLWLYGEYVELFRKSYPGWMMEALEQVALRLA